MSELPPDLRELLDASKRAHEPDQARLDQVYQRVVYAPHVKSEYDVAPPRVPRPRLPWGSMLTAGALAVTSWWATSTPQVAAPHVAEPRVVVPSVEVEASSPHTEAAPSVEAAPRVEPDPSHVEAPPSTALPRMEPTRSAPASPPVAPPRVQTEKKAPSATPVVPSVAAGEDSGPSSDWPVAKPNRHRTRAPAEPALSDEAPPEDAPRAPSLQPRWEDLGGDGDTRMVEAHAPTVVAPTREETDSLGDEVRWLIRARQALERGEWKVAQEALEEHQYAHPIGQLQAERRALLARARCLGGDLAGARRLYVRLREEAGSASLLRSVERACPAVAP